MSDERRFQKQVVDADGIHQWENIDPIDIKAGDAFRAWEGSGDPVKYDGKTEFLAIKDGQSVGPNMSIVAFCIGSDVMFSRPVAGKDY